MKVKVALARITRLLAYEELTLCIYELGRIIIWKLCPEELANYPLRKMTKENELALLKKLVELLDNTETSNKYLEI